MNLQGPLQSGLFCDAMIWIWKAESNIWGNEVPCLRLLLTKVNTYENKWHFSINLFSVFRSYFQAYIVWLIYHSVIIQTQWVLTRLGGGIDVSKIIMLLLLWSKKTKDHWSNSILWDHCNRSFMYLVITHHPRQTTAQASSNCAMRLEHNEKVNRQYCNRRH